MSARNTPLSPFTRIAMGFVAVNALAGALSLILFPGRTDSLFFWEISPPINAALFGALYFVGAIAVAWMTYKGEWEPLRVLIPVLVSAGILITITTLLHLDRFSPGIKLAYWLGVYIGAPLLALFIYVGHQRAGANWTVSQPVLPAVRAMAVALGAPLLALTLALIVEPGWLVPYWPWPTSPLMVRVFASWFGAFGVGLLWFWIERDWRRVQLIATLMVASAVVDLLMIAVHSGDLTSTGLNLWVYFAHLGLVGVVGGVMHWLQRRAAQGA